MEKYYMTVRAARAAACLDAGFDPFRSGGWGRCTKASLAARGYIVDPARAKEMAADHRCADCQMILDRDWNGTQYVYPTHCESCRRYNYRCDNGHAWQATDDEDRQRGHRCPRCGEYWV